MNDLQSFFNGVSQKTTFPCSLGETGGYINLKNSGRRGSVKEFTLSLATIVTSLENIKDNLNDFANLTTYEEKAWRDTAQYFTDLSFQSLITVQTKPCFTTLSKIISWANGKDANLYDDNQIDLSENSLNTTISKLNQLISAYTPTTTAPRNNIVLSGENCTRLPKPFLLLAGISGTGKTRFIREQAEASGTLDENYELVAVRPDWHEPSDLLGYISRLSSNGAEYITTDVVKFLAKAWRAIFDAGLTIKGERDGLVLTGEGDQLNELKPYWLCLDEMNLAPVEQYFSDYLSILETREWKWSGNNFTYRCDAILKPSLFKQVAKSNIDTLQEDVGLENHQELWELILEHGLSIPPNLIVAGTVNMDETTHGFSRKVIDRALSFDFGEFFPNDYDQFFKADTKPKALTFPIWSQATEEDLSSVTIDSDGTKTINFLTAVNAELKNSPFELAYRALNELLLSVIVFNPKNNKELQAVWDDFLMCKVLPRIEGDLDKLRGEDGILASLETLLEKELAAIWDGDESRKDLYRTKENGGDVNVACRSKKKLAWMKERLSTAGFTSFWP